MAAHLLNGITEELARTIWHRYTARDYELLIHAIDYSKTFEYLDISEYVDIRDWCKRGIRYLEEEQMDASERSKDYITPWEHQHQFVYIAWAVIAKAYPEWVKLDKPSFYEEWRDAKYPPAEEEEEQQEDAA